MVNLFKLLHGLYFAKVPTMLWGNPGSGKTSTILALGEKLGVTCELRSANKSDCTDFSGLPFIDTIKTKTGKDKKVTKYSQPKYVRNLKKDPNGILFFDELTTCTPAIQTALLTIIQDCEFGEFSVPKSIFRIAAGNYTNVVGTHSVSMAFNNRCVHLFVKPNVQQFCSGIVSGFSNYEYAVINSEKDIEAKRIQYSVAVSDFIKANPNQLPEDIPENVVLPTDVAYPTERSWSNAITLLSVLDGNDDEYIKTILDGCIGLEASKLFRSYLKTTKKFVNLLDYIGKEKTFKLPEPNKIEQVLHIMEAIVSLVKNDPEKYFKLWVRIINLLHNKDKKYGNYTPYDSFIIQYMAKSMEVFDKAQMLSQDTILSLHGKTKKEELKIDDFSKLHALSVNGSLLRK